MKIRITGLHSFIVALLLLFCHQALAQASISATKINSLHLLSVYNLPHNLSFQQTTIGGLSGIDFDAKNDCYYLISDDRSTINPARFYTAKLFITEKGIDSVRFTSVVFMKQANGTMYPNSKQNPARTPDPENIRYNPTKQQLIWTSEGERMLKVKDTVLENPAITEMDLNGNFIDSFPLPTNLYMHTLESGPRQNSVLEGCSFSNNYKTLFVNVEEPLYQDGPRATLQRNNALIRLYQFDVASKKNTAQYAYELDPVAFPASPPDGYKINGASDILALNDKQLLVLERSYSSGRLACSIKVFLAELQVAEDIKNNPSLLANPPKKTVGKKLLLNMDDLGIYIDNLEGVCLGPTLPNGHNTLVFVTDNNFSPFEKTQFILFELR